MTTTNPPRPIDTYSWGSCVFEYGLMFLIKIASFELQAQAMPHSDGGWGSLNDDGDPPIEFIRSMIGAQALDDLNRMLEESERLDDLLALRQELAQ